MYPEPQLFLLGLSWRTAPVDVRGRFAIAKADLPARLAQLKALEDVEEAWLLTTCNRTEALVAARPSEALYQRMQELLFPGSSDEHIFSYQGVHAVIHVFRVAAGLDSLVLGESEILSQVRGAMQLCREHGGYDRNLDPLLQQALSVGKKVRTKTAIGKGSLSIARVGVELAARAFAGFERHRALILGAGDTARLVATHLRARNVAGLVFANRTLENAQAAAKEFDCEATDLNQLSDYVKRADFVIACVDGAAGILNKSTVLQSDLRRRDQPLMLIDLSVPRAVDPALLGDDSLIVYDLDDVQRMVAKNRAQRATAMREVDDLLVGEVHKFVSLRTFANFAPAVEELRERFGSAREQILREIAGMDAPANMVELSELLTRRLMDISLNQMKKSARHASPEAILDQKYREFLGNL